MIPRINDPSREQTIEAIGEYYRNAKPGAVAVIRETYVAFSGFVTRW
jgi:hypothetical protein